MCKKKVKKRDGHRAACLSINCRTGLLAQPFIRKQKDSNKIRSKSVKHLNLVKGKDGYYRVEGMGRIAFCPQTAKRLHRSERTPRRMVLTLSRKLKRGLIRIKFSQLASVHDPHDVRMWDGLLAIPRLIFKIIAYSIAKLKRWASFADRTGYVYVSLVPC